MCMESIRPINGEGPSPSVAPRGCNNAAARAAALLQEATTDAMPRNADGCRTRFPTILPAHRPLPYGHPTRCTASTPKRITGGIAVPRRDLLPERRPNISHRPAPVRPVLDPEQRITQPLLRLQPAGSACPIMSARSAGTEQRSGGAAKRATSPHRRASVSANEGVHVIAVLARSRGYVSEHGLCPDFTLQRASWIGEDGWGQPAQPAASGRRAVPVQGTTNAKERVSGAPPIELAATPRS